jgi:hypothetical protein
MSWQELYQRFVNRPQTSRPVRPHAGRRRRVRLAVERLEDRLQPSATWVDQGPGVIHGLPGGASVWYGGNVEGIPNAPMDGDVQALAGESAPISQSDGVSNLPGCRRVEAAS